MTLFAGRKCFEGKEYVEMEPNTFRIHFGYTIQKLLYLGYALRWLYLQEENVLKETNMWRWNRIHFEYILYFFEIYHSETLFLGYALRWLYLQEEHVLKERNMWRWNRIHFEYILYFFWDIPFRNFIPRVCTQMTLFGRRKMFWRKGICGDGTEYIL